MQKERIYVAGADMDFIEMLRMRLLSEGFSVYTFEDETELVRRLAVSQPDLIIIASMYKWRKGMETCIRLREKTLSLIYMIGPQASDADQVTALSVGADVCFSRPFNTSVLIAQIHASFRRFKLTEGNKLEDEGNAGLLIDYPDLKINTANRSVIVHYMPVFLTAIEFDILALLAGNPNQVFYTSQIFRSVWFTDNALNTDERTVTVHISNLRRKIENDPLHPKYIITVRGIGYKFKPE